MPKVVGSGRKVSSEWAEVLKVDGDSKCKCKHCNNEISSKIERIRAHLKKCQARNRKSEDEPLQIDLREECSTIVSPSSSASSSVDTSCAPTPVSASSISKPFNLQPSISDFAIKTTERQKRLLDKAIAQFFFAANIPFNVAELKHL